MNKKKYERPTAQVLRVRTENSLLQASRNDYNGNGEEEWG